jgi:Holliday junction resolvasome RuvABC DNA-binding subunit
LLCASHNALRAREQFGAEHIEAKQREASAYQKTLSALTGLGFERRSAKAALEALRQRGARPEIDSLLRGALTLLVT